MKKKTGKVIEQKFLNQITMENKQGNLLTVNQYSLSITGDKPGLLYKRDKNLPQDILGKTISYQTTKEGLIFNSKILATKNKKPK